MFGGHRVEQGAGVGVTRIAQHLLHRSLFHRHAVTQHQHLIGQLRDHRQVMADDQQRIATGLDGLQHLKDLRLHGGIQRGGGFIGDHQTGIQCQRTGDQRALAQAAGQLIGTLPGP